MNWHLGWEVGLAELAVRLGEMARGQGFLVPSQMFFHLNPSIYKRGKGAFSQIGFPASRNNL